MTKGIRTWVNAPSGYSFVYSPSTMLNIENGGEESPTSTRSFVEKITVTTTAIANESRAHNNQQQGELTQTEMNDLENRIPSELYKDIYLRAASAGHITAIGYCYYFGYGKDQSIDKAVAYFREGANQGSAIARWNLGMCYANGEGVQKDEKASIELFFQGSYQGHSLCQNCLGFSYNRGEGVKRDRKKAAEFFAKAASQGNESAQYNLGACYMKGEGIKQDIEQAIALYEQAASKGHLNALNGLGAAYKSGKGVRRDPKKAFDFYTQAAAYGNADAQYNLALMYKYGVSDTVNKDSTKAKQLFKQAAEGGIKEARGRY